MIDETQEQNSISQTVEAMSRVRETGLDIGLSGIKDPQRYYLSNPILASEWVIQVKENFLTNSSRLLYERFFPNARYFAYGINMGGVKLEKYSDDSSINLRGIKVESSFVDKTRKLLESNHGIDPRPANLNQLSLAFAHFNASLAGVIIGPRNIQQLEDTLRYWAELEKSGNKSGWPELFNAITKID
jgi:aryl-alcohol dehydrogenase-like predicted oxidoreductase